mgnify:CR=1 FL=1
MTTAPRILVFIPAKNEADGVTDVIRETRTVITRTYQCEPEVLLISDGSTDETARVAHDAGATVIAHPTSRGLGTIFREAVDYAIRARIDYLVTIDGDRQFTETEIPKLLNPLVQNEADFASGNRFLQKNDLTHMSSGKRWGNRMVARIVNYILDSRYTDVSCGFRAYSREALLNLNLAGGFTYTQEVFLNLGFKGLRIVEIPISVTYFKKRKSRIARNLIHYGVQVSQIMLSSLIYYKPMKFFGTLTFWLWLFTLPVLGILGLRYLAVGLISPYKAVGILALTGFTLGILLLLVGVILYAQSRQQLSIDKVLYHVRQH